MKGKLPILLATLWVVWNQAACAMVPLEAGGVPMGMSSAAVKVAMRAFPGSTLEEEAPDHLTFKGGELSGLPVQTRCFNFVEDKMTRMEVWIVYPSGNDARGALADHMRDNVLQLLQQKYGPSKSQDGNGWYHKWQWSWPNPAVAKGTRIVQFWYGWHNASMSVVYEDVPPTETPTPTPTEPSLKKAPNQF